jgi:hypothetical protein
MTTAIEFEAKISVSSTSRLTVGESAWAPNIRLDEVWYPGRIIALARPIRPGERGRVRLGIFIDDDKRPTIGPGTRLMLYDGPSTVIADAVVTSGGVLKSRPVD